MTENEKTNWDEVVARPQRSTRDAWLDQFADWSPRSGESMLDILQLLHRQTVRRTLRGIEAKTSGQPAATLLDGQAESEAVR